MTTEERCPECNGYRGLPRILHDQDEPRECAHAFHKSVAPIAEFPGAAKSQAPPAPTESAPTPTVMLKPVCPHCGHEGSIAGAMTQLGPFQVMVIRCGNGQCRKILGAFQALGLEMMPPQSGISH
jgi:hypothetical protein